MSSIANKITETVKSNFGSHGEGRKLLVTGASGFVAASLMHELLNNGYEVVGTVRSEASANNIRKTHAKHGTNLSFVIVEDFSIPGAFDKAVQGVDGVCH